MAIVAAPHFVLACISRYDFFILSILLTCLIFGLFRKFFLFSIRPFGLPSLPPFCTYAFNPCLVVSSIVSRWNSAMVAIIGIIILYPMDSLPFRSSLCTPISRIWIFVFGPSFSIFCSVICTSILSLPSRDSSGMVIDDTLFSFISFISFAASGLCSKSILPDIPLSKNILSYSFCSCEILNLLPSCFAVDVRR